MPQPLITVPLCTHPVQLLRTRFAPGLEEVAHGGLDVALIGGEKLGHLVVVQHLASSGLVDRPGSILRVS